MGNKIQDIFVSVVFLVDDKTNNISQRTKSLAMLLKEKYANYEIVLVDNGVVFSEQKLISDVLKKVSCIRVLQLSKVSENDTAIFAGVEASIGDYVCVLYDNDPVEQTLPLIVRLNSGADIVFGVARNLQRRNKLEHIGARLFYWYNRKFLNIDIPHGATYLIGMNRAAVNALTRSGRYSKHIRYLSKQIGFKSENYEYDLPRGKELYTSPRKGLLLRAINLTSSYSSHPLRVVTYFGFFAGILNLFYALYVVVVNLSRPSVAQGWTTLSLQASLMFFFVFMILAMLAEYVGQILEEARNESPYHIKHELSSIVSIADETRRNVTK